MDRALVVLENTDKHRQLLREAGELATGVGASLVLLSTMTEDEFEENVETMEAIARVENTSYGNETVIEAAEQAAKEVAADVLDELDAEYETVGRVVEDDDRPNEILSVAEKRDCDHVFLRGRRRSPTGKAIFGDTAQSVILNFDGYVTIATN